MKVLLIHPPVYDFACHDFWLKPYGLLKLAGLFHQKGAQVYYFDFLDRFSPDVEDHYQKSDAFGKGKLPRSFIPKPDVFQHVPRRFKRYGRSRKVFEQFLKGLPPLDAVFITCTMTYWYPGIKELLPYCDNTPVYLGGGYASLLPEHAKSLGVQVVTHKTLPDVLSQFGSTIEEFYSTTPYWKGYSYLPYIVIRLSWGCPCHCTYCAVNSFYPSFIKRDKEEAVEEVMKSLKPETQHIVFYDDALLMQHQTLFSLCKTILSSKKVLFHTPNGLSINQMTREVSIGLKDSGFSEIYLGYESGEDSIQEKVGGKTSLQAFKKAIKALKRASYPFKNIHAYILMGHDLISPLSVEKSIQQVLSQGIHPLLAEYSPIPGTIDGDRVLKISPLEPLLTNKTSWVYQWAHAPTIRYLKELAHSKMNGI